MKITKHCYIFTTLPWDDDWLTSWDLHRTHPGRTKRAKKYGESSLLWKLRFLPRFWNEKWRSSWKLAHCPIEIIAHTPTYCYLWRPFSDFSVHDKASKVLVLPTLPEFWRQLEDEG